jgi:hypothetical protein
MQASLPRCAAVVLSAVVLALVVAATAFAAHDQIHLPFGSYIGGTASSSSYSSAWRIEFSGAVGWADRTVTLIDNTSYSWHGTSRGTGDLVTARWSSAAVKKGFCRLHGTARIECTVLNPY